MFEISQLAFSLYFIYLLSSLSVVILLSCIKESTQIYFSVFLVLSKLHSGHQVADVGNGLKCNYI